MINYDKQLGAVTNATRAIAHETLNGCAAAGHGWLSQVYGYNPASVPEHSVGRAIDYMCNREQGDWIADFLWTNRKRLGLNWIIWRQRIRSTTPGKGNGWRAMEDRGDPTQNHMDHVHAFFNGCYTPPADKGKPFRFDLLMLSINGKGGSSGNVALVEKWLGNTVDGKWGTNDTEAYAMWQKRCGYSGADADGIPGPSSLAALAKSRGYYLTGI